MRKWFIFYQTVLVNVISRESAIMDETTIQPALRNSCCRRWYNSNLHRHRGFGCNCHKPLSPSIGSRLLPAGTVPKCKPNVFKCVPAAHCGCLSLAPGETKARSLQQKCATLLHHGVAPCDQFIPVFQFDLNFHIPFYPVLFYSLKFKLFNVKM